ncbi:hypothetical protein H4R99_006874 [Coemansia sp. RSA 1722]|nr:hypothetical protein IWW45_007040 [Coemansia sp. RSA 485]KAJ2591110.1 hypothetical protein H4R99_006874 [Coemansia sp. RSA 1722]
MLATSNDPAVASAIDTEAAAANKPTNTHSTAKDDSGNLSTLAAASKKLAESEKKRDFSSRPVSTISGNSMTSVDDSQDSSGKQLDGQDSLSAMPTPRNTFLCPPTGINLPEGGGEGESEHAQAAHSSASPTALKWGNEQHQKQLQDLLEKKGIPSSTSAQQSNRESNSSVNKSTDSAVVVSAAVVASAEARMAQQIPSVPSYDDSYCLLAQSTTMPGYSPASREAAIAQLRRLAGAETRVNPRKRASEADFHMPPLLAPPVDAMCQLEEALMGVLTRRNVPNRTLAFCSRKASGAASATGTAGATGLGSAAASTTSAAGKAAHRKQRMSMMSAGQDASGGADDKRSNRSRVSVMSGEIASNLVSGTTPYIELNAHMERLTACISKLQALPGQADAAKPSEGSSLRSAASTPSPAAHRRQSSISSLGAKSFVSAQSASGAISLSDNAPPPMPAQPDAMQLTSPTHNRLPPVNENPLMEETADMDDSLRPRSSSHASVLSGASSESRRRIVVNEVPKSSQYPNLFGLQVVPASGSQTQEKMQPKQTVSSVTAASIHSSQSESSYTSGKPPMQQPGLADPLAPPEFDRASSVLSKPMSKSGGVSSNSAKLGAQTISLREITPASRMALWLNVHSAAESSKPSLWRRKQWHRRFAIFTGNVIYLFKSSSPAATALLTIRLNPRTIICVNDTFAGRTWVIEVTQPPFTDSQSPSSPTLSFVSTSAGASQVSQSWYLQTEMRGEMITLLKQLKGAVNDLQVQPDRERKEEERLRNRRRKQRKEAKKKTDVCPWEVEEFSEGHTPSSDSEYSEYSDDDDGEMGISNMHRIPDEELFPSDEEMALSHAADSQRLEAYSMSGNAKSARPAMLKINDYTGTGGIAEWGAHRLQMPFSHAQAQGANAAKQRSFSTDPSATTGRRPSLADALAPPPSAMQEMTPIPRYSPVVSPKTPPASISARSRSILGSGFSAMRNSMMLRSDASALIDQMFASASRELAGSASDSKSPRSHTGSGEAVKSESSNLPVVREE